MRKPPRKNFFSYILPFVFLICILFVAAYYIHNKESFSFITKSPAKLEVIKPEVKVLLYHKDAWLSAPENIPLKLFTGDSVRTSIKGEAKIHLFKDTNIYLNTATSVYLENFEESDSFQNTKIRIYEGDLYVHVERMYNPKSVFQLSMDNLQFITRGGDFLISKNSIKVLQGKVIVNRTSKESVVANTSVGVNQQLYLNMNDIGAFEDNQALETAFLEYEWIKRAKTVMEEKEEDIPNITVSSLEKEEGKEDEKDESVDKDLEITVTNPMKENVIEHEEGVLVLTGTVPKTTMSVQVNNYTLTQYTEAETNWVYRAEESWGNLKSGKNEYNIVAKLKGDKELKKTVVVNYSPKETETEEETPELTTEKKESKEESTTEDDKEKITDSEDSSIPKKEEKLKVIPLSVTSPKHGEHIDTNIVAITGTAPLNAAKITIDDYALQKYEAGSGTWKYIASTEFKNLEAGKMNSFIITSYDKDDNALASISFEFFSSYEETASE